MLLIGDLNCIPQNDKINLVVYNLNSLFEGVERVQLTPPSNIDYILQNEKEFDLMYANYIFSNDFTFMELMKIIINLYLGKDVFLVVTRNEIFDAVTEALTKLIQQRYGYNSQWINSVDDINIYDDSDFSIQGLYNLDIDKNRYESLVLSQNPNIVNQSL